MTTIDKHPLGSFCWLELATTDSVAAKKFYGELLGWTFDDMPIGPGTTYTMVKANGKTAGALFGMGKEMAAMSPPNWLAYIAVENADATAKQIVANGGSLVKEPFDVMDAGRMAVCKDPSGAHFAIWQAMKHQGAEVVQENGSLAWNELMTNNVDACGKFYTQTFGYKTEAQDMGSMGVYTLFKVPSDPTKNAAGMMGFPPDMKNVPPHWLSYITVSDVDASAKKVKALGGTVIVPGTDIPKIGRFAVIQDPQGASFALYKNAH